MRVVSGHNPTHYIASQSEHPGAYPPHYIPGVLAHQSSPTFTLRQEKPGISMDSVKGSSTPEPKGPPMGTVIDRPPSHSIPPHMSSPHGGDQRGTDSPSAGAVFPGQRQMYPASGLPQQQQPTRQAFSDMYAELETRQYVHSPSYIYDQRAAAVTAAAAAAAAMEQERGRPKGTSSPLELPIRMRSPIPNIAGDGLQGDSLLHLLQVCITNIYHSK